MAIATRDHANTFFMDIMWPVLTNCVLINSELAYCARRKSSQYKH